MKVVIDKTPSFCPECGNTFTWSVLALGDFSNGCSFSCKCGCQFQFVNWHITRDRLDDELDEYIRGKR